MNRHRASNIYRPSELHAFLKEHGAAARKSLSQNFLIDYNIIKKIVQAAQIAPNDIVIEIGPGPGALTEVLLDHGAHVIAIELDRKFAHALSRLQTEGRHLEIIEADVLKLDIEALCARHAKDKSIKVVANLPYHITTPILARLLPLHESITSLTLMVQKEFSERMVASVGTSSYSSFTVFLQFYCDVKPCFTISPTCFYPPPKVHSAVVQCTLHPPVLPEHNHESFFKMTRTAFQHRRKMLKSSLKELYSVQQIEEGLKILHVNPKVRPEELSLNQFVDLFRFLSLPVSS